MRPDPVPVTITQGTTLTGVDLDFTTIDAQNPGQSLSGRILQGGLDVAGTVFILKDISGSNEVYALVETVAPNVTNIYEVGLSPGTYFVGVAVAAGQVIPINPATMIQIVVDGTGITEGGVPLANNELDLVVP